MADETNTTPAADSKEKAKPTTLDGMTGYRTFDSTDEAADYLKKCAADFSDFASQPFATVGFDSDGNFDPAVYTDQMRVRVAVLRNVPRSVNGKREPTTIKAIVVTPVPTIPSLLGIDGDVWDKVKDSPSVQFVTKTLDKELNHIAVRPLRDAENIETAVEQVPTTREAFITSSRDTGGIMDTFNETYKTINDTLSKQVPLWSKARLIKAELKKAMESKAYALEYYPALEDRGDGKDSLFVLAMQFGVKLAKSKSLTTDIFDKWLATRDQQVLKQGADAEDEDVSLDDLTADLFGDDADDSTDTAKEEQLAE